MHLSHMGFGPIFVRRAQRHLRIQICLPEFEDAQRCATAGSHPQLKVIIAANRGSARLNLNYGDGSAQLLAHQ